MQSIKNKPGQTCRVMSLVNQDFNYPCVHACARGKVIGVYQSHKGPGPISLRLFQSLLATNALFKLASGLQPSKPYFFDKASYYVLLHWFMHLASNKKLTTTVWVNITTIDYSEGLLIADNCVHVLNIGSN